jgi:hypothetical protein
VQDNKKTSTKLLMKKIYKRSLKQRAKEEIADVQERERFLEHCVKHLGLKPGQEVSLADFKKHYSDFIN